MKRFSFTNTLQSFVVIPILAANIVLPTVGSTVAPTVVSSSDENRPLVSTSADNKQTDREDKAKKIDAFFKDRNMPLYGYGSKMILEAEKNDIDPFLLAAMAVRESTGGIHACKKNKYNTFGWGSCKLSFNSYDDAIETVARNLGGNNPNTAMHYDNKTTKGILQSYNPPSVVPRYAQQVMAIMDRIAAYDIGVTNSNELALKS
jgi:hypothetical protein